MYVDRLPSGSYGIFLDNGKRVAVAYDRKAAKAKMLRLQAKYKKS